MYQSFPQRRMCSSNSAMPVIKSQIIKDFCDDRKENEIKSDNCKNIKNENNENINKNKKCCDDKKQDCCEEKAICSSGIADNCNNNPLDTLFGDLFKNIEIDDLILIGVILFLLFEGEDNIITIGILALILFL